MNTQELKAIAEQAAKNIKTEQDLNEFRQMLTKVTVEAALNAELDDHLGYERHEKAGHGNSRNGYSSKTVQTEEGQFELNTPRDRNGDFDPQLVKKQQRRFTSMDDKILFLYAQGMTTREIVTTFKELYGAEVSATLISKVTNAVIDQVIDWQSRPLDPVYPIVYLDCIVLKIKLVNQGELTQQQIAFATGIDQGQISRILSGRIKRLSTNVKRLCEYARSLPEPQISRLNNREMITNAALDLWDGSHEHAKSLFHLFEAIKLLQSNRQRPRK